MKNAPSRRIFHSPYPMMSGGQATASNISSNNSATEVTLSELLGYVGIPASVLTQRCSDQHLQEIARRVKNWEPYAPCLGLGANDIEDLKDEFRKPELRSFNAFQRWKEKAAFKATYLYLVESVFLKCGNATMAEFVCN